jgi:gliding motility-associated-like protein
MKRALQKNLFFIIFLFISCNLFGKEIASVNLQTNSTANIAPVLSATGNQIYCPGSSVKIVTTMSITDPDDTGIDAIYIQISSGYVFGQDVLTLTGTHPNIIFNWNATTAILKLSGVATQPTYVALIAAIKDVEFSSSATNPPGTRNFSISVGQANYLPSNGHYYLYIPDLGIKWSDAKIAAQNTTYYGLQGYLATITSADEAQIAGEQTTGAGWIGGSDEATEGIWKWMTGPEAGLTFWQGNFTGFTTNYASWNTGEPNNQENENYAHITAPGVGISGSWNDLSDTGASSGDYQPQGYIVEYGGMPGDPVLQISTSTSLTIASVTSNSGAVRCGSGTVTLQAVSNTGIVHWYDAPTGGTSLFTGNSFTTPTIGATTLYYAAANVAGCLDTSRIPVTAAVTPKPVLTSASPYYMCDEAYTVVDVQTSLGLMFWYDTPTSTNPIFLGTHFVVPNIHQNTVYYAESNNNNCLSDRVPITINIYSAPNVVGENFVLCEGITVPLDAGNPGMTYTWSTGATTQIIQSNGLTNYYVVVTTPAPQSCSKTKNFTITYNAQPIISTIDVKGLQITISTTTSSADFEYSLDGQNFQSSNVFTVPEGGNYIAYVREINQCGFDQKPFVVISYPDFFTPNGDTINDHWYIKGALNFPAATVSIFDRFGKLITVLNTTNLFWDGTLNGKKLPAADYWFAAKIDNAFPEFKGHFSLLR